LPHFAFMPAADMKAYPYGSRRVPRRMCIGQLLSDIKVRHAVDSQLMLPMLSMSLHEPLSGQFASTIWRVDCCSDLGRDAGRDDNAIVGEDGVDRLSKASAIGMRNGESFKLTI
jgi:hypothetical protein